MTSQPSAPSDWSRKGSGRSSRGARTGVGRGPEIGRGCTTRKTAVGALAECFWVRNVPGVGVEYHADVTFLSDEVKSTGRSKVANERVAGTFLGSGISFFVSIQSGMAGNPVDPGTVLLLIEGEGSTKRGDKLLVGRRAHNPECDLFGIL